jgi:CRP-like cAMP-binding protein
MHATAFGPWGPRRNQLVASLDIADWERWQPHLEPVELTQGQVLCTSGDRAPYAYFPTTAVVSLQHLMRQGASIEVAVVGNDGVAGLSLCTGGGMPCRTVVQGAGRAYRLSAHTLRHDMHQAGSVLGLLLRYTQAVMAQMAQSAVCNRYHTIEQQFCRRLLLSLDRAMPCDEVLMTQELAANLLGVRREGVTATAHQLQHDGAIRYRRGRITVLDRGQLEARSCECYAAAKREYDRLLPLAIAA